MNRELAKFGRVAFGLAALALAGCTTSSVESRRTEKMPAYMALPAETRQLVDQGQIKVGMSTDAVYIAWGKPSEILSGESSDGPTTTWLYYGSWLEERRYWNYRDVRQGSQVYLERYLDHDYDSRSYVRAEIVFTHGTVKSWRTLPRPL